MPDTVALVTELNARLNKYNAEMAKAVKTAEGTAGDIERAFAASHKDIEKRATALQNHLNRTYRGIGESIGSNLARGSDIARLALAGVSAYAIKLSSDAGEIDSAFDVAFKGASKGAREFSETLSSKVGRDAVETREAMTKLQLVLTGTGVAAAQATKLTEALATASIDAGSLFNTTDAVAFQKVISGITGESEPLKEFGVVITEAAVKAELLRLGFKGNAEQASEAAKSTARANLILKGLAVAQGDAARTSGSAANQARAMRAEFNKAARDLGDQLLPTYVELLKSTTDVTKAFTEMPSGIQLAGLALLALVAAGGPIASVIGGFVNVIKLAVETKKAIEAIAAANAAAGLTAGGGLASAASGAALVGGLATAGVAYAAIGIKGAADAIKGGDRVTFVNELLKDPSVVRKLKGEDIQKLQALLRKDAGRKGALAAPMYGDFGADTQDAKDALGILAGELVARLKKAGATPTPDTPSFTLPDLLKTGTGTGTGSGGKKASPPGRTAAPVNVSDLIAVDERTVFDLATNLSGKPLEVDSNPADFRSADELIQQAYEPLKRLRDESYNRLYDGIRGGLEAGFREGLPGVLNYLKYAIQMRLLDSLATSITDALTGAGAGKGGGVAKLAAGAFHLLGFAGGGNPPVGKPYVVGENGPEIRVDRAPSTIIPNALIGALQASTTTAPRAGVSNLYLHQTIDLTGANGDATIRAIAYDAAQAGFQAARAATAGDFARRARNSLP